MDVTSFFFGIVLGLGAGAVIAWLAGRVTTARILSRLDAERQGSAEKLALLARTEAGLRDVFASLSAEALRQNNRSFLDLAQTKLGQLQQSASADLERRRKAVDELVRPIGDALARIDGTLHEVEKDRIASYAGLAEQINAMGRTHQALQAETVKLAKALRAPQVRGRWGEIQLRRVVEMAGMLDYCDFEEQATVAGNGGSLRPDLVVRLPGGKIVVVDAKAPMAAYLDAVDGSLEDAERERLLRDHARQVRDHMITLGSKAYWSQFEAAPDFVVMFLPGETFFSAACQHDPSLIEFGVGQQVIPASPTTLISLLRAVAYGWRQERIARNAREISDLGRQLHDRIGTLAGHFEDLRRSLDRAVESYNKAVGSLEGRVLASARRFKELGVTTEDLPPLPPIEQAARELMTGD
ncbi:MAG TPA: DNA recombination protein RmuC [Gemmatimonadales bacterium]|jgi:DNA recombination protein RmuC